MSRDILIETVAAVVREFQPEHVVDLANPEVCIIVQVFKGTAGISVVKNYHERSKFNIEQVAAK